MRTIQPPELASDAPHGPWSCRGRDIWDAFCAAAVGDAKGLRAVLAREANLYRAEYWYTQPIHFAVREGQLEAVRVLLEAGADPGAIALSGDDLLTTASDRGYDAVVRLLAEERDRRGRIAPERASSGPPYPRRRRFGRRRARARAARCRSVARLSRRPGGRRAAPPRRGRGGARRDRAAARPGCRDRRAPRQPARAPSAAMPRPTSRPSTSRSGTAPTSASAAISRPPGSCSPAGRPRTW